MAPPDELHLKNPPFAAFLGWLVPGLGHVYQGRIGKGILYFVCVLSVFFFGFQQGGWQIVYFRWDKQEWRWPYLAQAGVGLGAMPALFTNPEHRRWLPEEWRDFETPPTEQEIDDLHRAYGKRMDIAVVYTMIAGLLNILAIYDALAGPAMYEEERRRLAAGQDDLASGEPAAS